jgi:menaquinone-dependent protoporphyrinogen IX oxidase
MTNKTRVTYFLKGGASEEYTKIIAETLTENGLTIEIYNLTHDIHEVADFEILKKEEKTNEIRKINK